MDKNNNDSKFIHMVKTDLNTSNTDNNESIQNLDEINDKRTQEIDAKHVSTKNLGFKKILKKSEISILKIAIIIFSTIIFLTLIKIDKLSSYWHQTYNSGQPFEQVAESDIGIIGQEIEQSLSGHALEDNLHKINTETNTFINKQLFPATNNEKVAEIPKETIDDVNKQPTADVENITESEKIASDNLKNSDVMSILLTQTMKPQEALNHIHIQDGDKVFFVGDSLMQGVAPWIMRELQNNHQINSINLSKQSTGLTSTKFFDWPQTVKDTIIENPEISAIFVFLGGNDGQSIVDVEAEPKRHVRFASERWDELYKQNIKSILKVAHDNDIQVLWVTPPTMKKSDLNKQVIHLSNVYTEVVSDAQSIVLDSNIILQINTPSNKYSDTMLIDGKQVKVRTADGVHFTVRGQKEIAKSIMKKIVVNNQRLIADTL